MTRTWRNATKLNKGSPWGYGARCPSCDGPRLFDGRCAVSGHTNWCESDSSRFEDGERQGWTPQPNGNREAMERVRKARHTYFNALRSLEESRPS